MANSSPSGPLQTATSEPEKTSASLFGVASRDLKRLNRIVAIIVKHGFGEIFQRTPLGRRVLSESASDAGAGPSEAPSAERFRRLLENLGPTYIKFGQILSMRRDVLPAAYIHALEGLQDGAPVVPLEQVREVICQGLGRQVEELFLSFDERPLATASIGQTHRAVTKQGEQVVVKVQRPGIEQTMRGDLDLLFILAKALEVSIEEVQLVAPAEMVAEFERSLLRELNFTEEFANLVTARKLVAQERQVVVPKPYPELSCRTVLTMEYFCGQSIRHLQPSSDAAKQAVEEVFHCAIKQVLHDGFFHADPHMGNILINSEQQLCLLDFGLVGRLSETQRNDLVDLVMAAVLRDVSSMARLLLRMGTPTERVNIAELKAEITRVMDQFLTDVPLGEVDSAGFIEAFVAAAQHFKIKLSSDYALLVKAIVVVEGIARTLHPDLDVVRVIKPYAEAIVSKKLSPQQIWTESLGGVGQFASLLRQLPTLFEQMLHDAETGQIQIRAVTPQLDQLAPLLHQTAGRLSLASFAGAMTIAAALLIGLEGAEARHQTLIVLVILAAASAWSILLTWHFVGRGRPFKARKVVQFFKR